MLALFQELGEAAEVGAVPDRERADLLETLRTHRVFLRHTLGGLSEEQARQRPTVSSLSVGGLVTHVAATEAQWADFILRGAEALGGGEDGYARAFEMTPDDTVDRVLAQYAEVAERTDALVRSLPDLDASRPLPPAPWFRAGEERSARRVLLHLIAERRSTPDTPTFCARASTAPKLWAESAGLLCQDPHRQTDARRPTARLGILSHRLARHPQPGRRPPTEVSGARH